MKSCILAALVQDPRVSLDLHDRLVLYKPAGWEVHDGFLPKQPLACFIRPRLETQLIQHLRCQSERKLSRLRSFLQKRLGAAPLAQAPRCVMRDGVGKLSCGTASQHFKLRIKTTALAFFTALTSQVRV